MAAPRLDRRTFLRLGGAGALSAAVAGALDGCGGGPSHAVHHVVEPATAALWRALGQALEGRLILRGDPGYATARLLYDPKFDGLLPLGIARCASSDDVARVVHFARDHGYPLAVRSGGHSYGGWSSGDGRLVVDVSAMSAVRPATFAGGVATVGAGARLIDLYEGLGSVGQLVPGGSCPTVGVAGLTLGGGVGVFARQFGLACDQLEWVEVVTADGVTHRCSAGEEADLFWACQGGGGGNFGVATQFGFRTNPIPQLTLFTYDFDASAAAEVLGAWQHWVVDLESLVWSNCQLLAGGGSVLVRVNGVGCDAPATVAALVSKLLAAAPEPTASFLGGDDYVHSMMVEGGCGELTVAACHLEGTTPQGVLSRQASSATSNYVAAPMGDARLDAVADLVTAFLEEDPLLGGGLAFDALGGAVNERPASATAFVHRRFLCSIQSSFTWGSGATASALAGGRAWLDEVTTRVYDPANGAYQNYADPTLADWADAYYGTNLPRLERIKRRVDPDDVFHFAQSIPPG